MENKSRKELQALAKSKGIKANLSSSKIIQCLDKPAPDCNKTSKLKANKTRKQLQELAKKRGIKANMSNDKIMNCLKQQTPDCNKKTRKQAPKQKQVTKQAPKQAKIPQIGNINILHDLAYIPDNKYDHYNEGANVAKTDAQIDTMNNDQYFSKVKSFYENKKTLRAELWPKAMDEDNQVVPEVSVSKLTKHILSLCKNQPLDAIEIRFRTFNQYTDDYTVKHHYLYRCNEEQKIKRALETTLNKLQTFPFENTQDYNDFMQNLYRNPFREELGVVNVEISFTTVGVTR